MKVPGCPYEVERARCFEDLRAGVMVCGYPCGSCGGSHLFFLSKPGRVPLAAFGHDARLCTEYWHIAPSDRECDPGETSIISKADVEQGVIYLVVTEQKTISSLVKEKAS